MPPQRYKLISVPCHTFLYPTRRGVEDIDDGLSLARQGNRLLRNLRGLGADGVLRLDPVLLVPVTEQAHDLVEEADDQEFLAAILDFLGEDTT